MSGLFEALGYDSDDPAVIAAREAAANEPARIKQGTKVLGFGHGVFGRDSYGDKTCIETGFYGGFRWALFHEKGGYGSSFHVVYGEQLEQLERWEHNDRVNGVTE